MKKYTTTRDALMSFKSPKLDALPKLVFFSCTSESCRSKRDTSARFLPADRRCRHCFLLVAAIVCFLLLLFSLCLLFLQSLYGFPKEGKMMKFSFSLPTIQSSRPQQSNLQLFDASEIDDHDDESSVVRTEFITEFDPSKTLSDPNKIIIPPKPNEWRPHKRMKNLELPVKSEDQNLKFEAESVFIADPMDFTVSYGMNLWQPNNTNGVNSHVKSEPESDERIFQRSVSVDGLMLQKLHDDLDKLPEDRGFEEFTDVPVEGFGAALLAGYGWYEGRGIGKMHKKDVKVVECKRWNAREGLGFVSTVTPQQSPPKIGMVHDKKDEIFFVGKEVRVIGGQHIGEMGKVLEVNRGSNSVILSLSSSEEVNVETHNIAELGSLEEEKFLMKSLTKLQLYTKPNH